MAQKKQTIEYRLLVQPTFDETLKKAGIMFLLETSKQFTNFSYILDVKDSVDGNTVVWTLHGLRAPSMIMPATGSAKFHKVYFDLPRSVHFTLIKKAKVKADADLTFSKIIVSSKKVSAFLKIYTDPNEFETQRVNDLVMAEPKPDQHRDPSTKQQRPTKQTKQ